MPSKQPIAFIQARMASSRYPGKSLAPLAGTPVIKRVIKRVNKGLPKCQVVVLTTHEPPEDPLVSYLRDENMTVLRGHPTNVFHRFKSALEEYPCESFFRICGDSPFLEPTLLQKAKEIFTTGDWDIVTNVCPRDFPAGKSVELLDANVFNEISVENLSTSQVEHVTKYFYDNKKQYKIKDIKSPVSDDRCQSYAVDTLDDLKRLEKQLNNKSLNEKDFRVL